MSAARPLLTYAALCVTPALVFGVIDAVLSPADNRVKRLGGWAIDLVGGGPRRKAEEAPVIDPFAVLAVQLRLERLAREVEVLETHPRGSARGHHLRVALGAYDDVLDEACRMAGVPATAESGRVARLRKEKELRARGWTW